MELKSAMASNKHHLAKQGLYKVPIHVSELFVIHTRLYFCVF